MRYRRFGQTGLQVSVFSLGTMRYLASEENAKATVQRAIALGINHLETAQGYGKSEEYLGAALRDFNLNRSELYLTTKIVPTVSAPEMEQAIQTSLQRLGVDYIDCLALHGVNTEEHLAAVQDPQGCMSAVQAAIAQGQVRHVGFSTHGPLDVILAAIETNLFEFVNLHYTYFFQRNAPALARAAEKDMGVFIISPADKGGRLYTPSAQLTDLCAPFSPLALNYRFLLSDRRITTLSVGPANPAELELPLAGADHDQPLSQEEQAVLQNLGHHAEQTLQTDYCHQCYACLPCPEQIHIPEVLRLRNLAVAYEMTDFAQYRYGMFENAGHWFPGTKANRCTECGDCLPRCPQELDIPKLVQDAHDRLKGQSGRRLWG